MVAADGLSANISAQSTQQLQAAIATVQFDSMESKLAVGSRTVRLTVADSGSQSQTAGTLSTHYTRHIDVTHVN